MLDDSWGCEPELGCCSGMGLVDCAMAEDRKARQAALASRLFFTREVWIGKEIGCCMCVFIYRGIE